MPKQPEPREDIETEVERIREFNRFYTQRIGVVGDLGGDLSLPAARILFELARRGPNGRPAGIEVAQSLELDPGYVSRLLKQLERKGFVERRRSADDGRRRDVVLTRAGRGIHDDLTERTRRELGGLIEPLETADRRRLLGSMDTITRLLRADGDDAERRAPCVLREHRAGDLGWVVHRHGVLYGREYGFDQRFEALVAKIVADFGHEHDPSRERLWIAEQAGEPVGSILLVCDHDRVSRLRLFLVEPTARGLGLGKLLSDTCLAFARDRGYESMVLSTVRELDAARHIYQKLGFELIESGEAEAPWGPTVHPEEWRLELGPAAG